VEFKGQMRQVTRNGTNRDAAISAGSGYFDMRLRAILPAAVTRPALVAAARPVWSLNQPPEFRASWSW
jgi:hypothetical protein